MTLNPIQGRTDTLGRLAAILDRGRQSVEIWTDGSEAVLIYRTGASQRWGRRVRATIEHAREVYRYLVAVGYERF